MRDESDCGYLCEQVTVNAKHVTFGQEFTVDIKYDRWLCLSLYDFVLTLIKNLLFSHCAFSFLAFLTLLIHPCFTHFLGGSVLSSASSSLCTVTSGDSSVLMSFSSSSLSDSSFLTSSCCNSACCLNFSLRNKEEKGVTHLRNIRPGGFLNIINFKVTLMTNTH